MQYALFDLPTYDATSVLRYFLGVSNRRDFRGVAAAGAPAGVSWPHLGGRVTEDLIQYLDDGFPVFIDSGAFSQFKAEQKAKAEGSTASPPPDFGAILAGYRAIARRTRRPEKLTVQSLDRVGDQAATWDLLVPRSVAPSITFLPWKANGEGSQK